MTKKTSIVKSSSRRAVKFLCSLLLSIFLFGGMIGTDTAYAADIATGTSGTVDWVIDAAGVLTLTPSSGADSGTMARSGGAYNSSPWSDYASEVKSFKIAEGKEVFGGSSISHMFYYCNYLTSVDFTGFDTSNTTNMNYLFYRCESLTSVDLSGLDTSNVTSMNQMFYYCEALTSVDFTNFDTSKVASMEKMFEGCGDLRSLDLTNFSGTASLNTNLMFGQASDFTVVNLTSVVFGGATNANIKSAIPAPTSGVVNSVASSTTTGKWINKADNTVYDSLASVGAGTYEAQVVYNITNATITDIPSHTYNGTAHKPVPALTLNGRSLVTSDDFTYTYATEGGTPIENPTGVGTYIVNITGVGNYNNTTFTTFDITPMSLPADCIESIPSRAYSGTPYKPVPVVSVNNTDLQLTQDFTYSYKDANNQPIENPTDAGTYSVVVTGNGNYSGSAQVNFSITIVDMTNATIEPIADTIYSGSPYKPVPEIVLNGVTPQAGTDFLYRYSDITSAVITDPIDAGTYTIDIEGEGNYSGSLSTNFTINKKDGENGTATSTVDYDDTATKNVDISSAIPADAGTITEISVAETDANNCIASSSGDKDNKTVSYTLEDGLANTLQSATLTATVKTQNYQDFNVVITITLSPRRVSTGGGSSTVASIEKDIDTLPSKDEVETLTEKEVAEQLEQIEKTMADIAELTDSQKEQLDEADVKTLQEAYTQLNRQLDPTTTHYIDPITGTTAVETGGSTTDAVARLVVEPIVDGVDINEALEGLPDGIDAKDVQAYDLSLHLGDTEVQPNGELTITLHGFEDYKGEYITISHKVKNENWEHYINVPVSDDGTVTLTVTSLSPFVFFSTGDTPLMVFDDVDTDDWYYDAVLYAFENEIMTGTSDTTYAPNDNMTRAMVWTVLARMSSVDTNDGDPWYSVAMDWAVENEVSDGLNPDGNITREEFATMLYRYAGSPMVTAEFVLGEYSDYEQVSEWANLPMDWAVKAGIITGIDGTLEPQGEATRAQMATMLMRYMEME